MGFEHRRDDMLTAERLHREKHPDRIRMYDTRIESFRDATQADFDLVFSTATEFARLRDAIDRLHAGYLAERMKKA